MNMVQIVEYRMTMANDHENRLSVIVRYRKKSYAVVITTYHDFENGKPIVKYINSFGYLSNVERKSDVRDNAIKRALVGMTYEYNR